MSWPASGLTVPRLAGARLSTGELATRRLPTICGPGARLTGPGLARRGLTGLLAGRSRRAVLPDIGAE